VNAARPRAGAGRLWPRTGLRRWREWTLRSRMVVALAGLAAVALILVDAAGMVLLQDYLVGRVDAQLTAQGRRSGGTAPAELGSRARGGANFGPDYRLYRYTADGARLADAGIPHEEVDLGPFADLKAHANEALPVTVSGPSEDWRVMVNTQADGTYLVRAVSLRDIEATADRLLAIDAAVTALVLLLIGFAAASVVRIGLRPLTRMEHIAAEIAGGNLSRRVDDADPHTESGRLGTALNTMLGRIEGALDARTASEQRLRQFLADAAHELRTPLTSIQGFAELYRRGGVPPGPELDEVMGRVEAEVGRMGLLVNDLLLLARLDEERPLERHPVDLLAVAADTVRDAHVRVPGRFVALTGLDASAHTFEPVTVLGDEARIRQVVTNLIANALQHTPERASIAVRVGRLVPAGPGERVAPSAAVGPEPPTGQPLGVIEVVDTGPGMSPDDAGRAFERLYRADPSRSRRHGGAGLGLSIAAAIVALHGGRVELWTEVGQGSRFRVLLPAEPGVDDQLPASSEVA